MAFSSRLLRAVTSSVAVAVDREPGRAVHADLDAGRLRGQPAAGERLVHQLVHVDGAELGQPFGTREPRQRDQLGDERAQPRRLLEDPAGEAAHLGGVVRGVEHGLGQQPDRADGRLELVADVRDEVAPGRLQPHGVRAVGGLDDREPVAEPADLAEHGGGLAAAALQRRQVDLHQRPARGAGGRPAGTPCGRAGRPRRRGRARGRRRAGCAGPPRPMPVSTASPASEERNTRSSRSARVGPGSSAGAPDAPARGTGARPARRQRATPPPSPASSATAARRNDASRLTAAW